MKAIILAAGKGERLKEVVDYIPKPMVKIKGKSILEHNIEWLKSFGLKDIYVNLHHLPDVIKDHLGNGTQYGVNITYSYEKHLLGTAGAVKKIATEYWKKDPSDTFLVAYGDNLLSDFNLLQITEFHRAKKGIGTICLYHKDDVSQSGVAVLDGDRIVDFIEKPEPSETTSHIVNTGIYVLEQRILKYIPDGFSDFGHDIFRTVLDAEERLYGFVSNRKLVAVDTPELLRQVVKSTSEK